tara:strand:- start:236 stop:493 length:258 start_codon:yes stop_codon:yes gene_type:complete
MSKEQLAALDEKVKTDTELLSRLAGAESAEAAIQIAKDAGFSITEADIQSMQSKEVELSDDELDAAAGGLGGWSCGMSPGSNPWQ